MNWYKIKVVYFKEMLDLFRDKRTIVTSILLPVILYPFLSIFVSSIASRQETKISESHKTIYVSSDLATIEEELLYENIKADSTLKVNLLTGEYWNDHFKELVETNDIQAFITLNDSISNDYNKLTATIFYNNTDEKSQVAYRVVTRIINDTNWEVVEKRLADLNLDNELISAVQHESKDVAPPQKVLGALLGKFLAYMLIILTLSSGSVVASDLVAGEKDRGTLETILVSAVSRIELVTGKFLTILTFCFITVFMNILSMYVSTRHILGMAQVDMSTVQMPVMNFFLIFIAMVPLAVLFSGIQLSLSTYSRNIKECSSYQTPLLIIGMMFSMVSIFPGFEINYGYALIPIINFALLLKAILLGNYTAGHFITVVAANLFLAAISLKLSVTLFNKEDVLFRTKAEKNFKFWGKSKRDIFDPGFAGAVFIVVLMLFYYLGTAWQGADLIGGLIKTELILVLLPVILIYRISRKPIASGARLQGTNPLNFLLMLVAVFPGFIIAASSMQLVDFFFPIPESYLKAMEKILEIHQLPLLQAFLVMGVLPGVCEEMLFRGYIIRGFEKLGKWQAIVISGVLFGVFHLDFFRLLPAAIMGIWLGYLLLKTRSIFLTMIAHTLHNSFTVVLSRWGSELPILKDIIANDEIPLWLLLASLAAIYLIIRALEKLNPSDGQADEVFTQLSN